MTVTNIAGGAASRAMMTSAFGEHSVMIRSIAGRLCGENSAADVAQDVFVRMWRNPDGYDPSRGTTRQYFCTLARGVAIDHLRKRTATRLRDEKAMCARDVGDDISQPMIDQQTAAVVQRGLVRLAPDERAAIAATFYANMSYREAAVRLGIAEATLKGRVRTGLRKLRNDLAAAGRAASQADMVL
jgi:RNA polymerase sigma-70 factor (ECF subfamily)